MPQNLKPLTSLRFFAAIWVVAYHFWPNISPTMPALVGKGYLGVELFFVLSGFILSHVYLTRFKTGTFHYREFIWARLARIYPLHLSIILGLLLLVLALGLIGIKTSGQLIVWSSLPAQLTLTQAWGLSPHGGWNHPSWSISAEWFAYLTFPLFAWLACWVWDRPRVAAAGAAALLVVLYLAFGRITGQSLTQATIFWGALRIVPCFALGCTMWLLWNADLVRQARSGLIVAGASLLVLLGSAVAGLPDFLTVIACAGLILGLGLAAKHGSLILSNAALVYLGEVSFAVYMVCIPWQLVATQGLQKFAHIDPDHMPLAVWLTMFAGVVPAAMIMHHAVERPARELMRHVKFGKRDPVDVVARIRSGRTKKDFGSD